MYVADNIWPLVGIGFHSSKSQEGITLYYNTCPCDNQIIERLVALPNPFLRTPLNTEVFGTLDISKYTKSLYSTYWDLCSDYTLSMHQDS